MPIVFEECITRAEIRKPASGSMCSAIISKKEDLEASRASAGRTEAIGIPTKKAPSMAESAFFSDADYELLAQGHKASLAAVKQAIFEGKTVVFPKAGLGTGLAELPAARRASNAPSICLSFPFRNSIERCKEQALGRGKPVGRR